MNKNFWIFCLLTLTMFPIYSKVIKHKHKKVINQPTRENHNTVSHLKHINETISLLSKKGQLQFQSQYPLKKSSSKKFEIIDRSTNKNRILLQSNKSDFKFIRNLKPKGSICFDLTNNSNYILTTDLEFSKINEKNGKIPSKMNSFFSK